jgi:hypothetical protein
VEEQLFARGKNKIGSAVNTLQYLVLEFHPSPHSPLASRSLRKAQGFPYARVRSESLRTPPQTIALDSAPPADHAGYCFRRKRWSRTLEEVQHFRMRDAGKRNGSPPPRQRPIGCQSCSLRAFLRLRFRAKASLTRFFSPGFR